MPSSEREPPLLRSVPLAPLTTLGVGGVARWFCRAQSIDDIEAAQSWSADRQLPLVILGGGSNVVISDAGVAGVVVQVAIRGIEWFADSNGTTLDVGAGEPWDDVVAAATSRGLAGLECLSGIPGLAGGTPIQNVGAYGQEVAGVIAHVTAFDRSAGRMTTLQREDCGFGYRTSRFRRQDAGRFIVCGMRLRLQPGPPTMSYPDVIREIQITRSQPPTVADVRAAVLAIRRRKGMVIDPMDPDTRSVGSFFVNPVVDERTYSALTAADGRPAPGYPAGAAFKVPAAWLIEQSGLGRGHRDGRVGLSSKHPLAIVNRGGASARDVLAFAAGVRRRVFDRFGVSLKAEPVFVALDDDPDAVYLQQETG